jgi:signal transduction histidine kinase
MCYEVLLAEAQASCKTFVNKGDDAPGRERSPGPVLGDAFLPIMKPGAASNTEEVNGINDRLRCLPVWLRRYLLAFSQLILGTALADLLMHVYGVKSTMDVSLIGDFVFLGCAWLGYGEGVLAGILITFVIPRLLLPGTPLHPDAGRFGLLLVLSLLISSISAYRRKAERALKFAADELESRVQARTLELQKNEQQLRRANEELRQFAYAAAHDMQEPLRNIVIRLSMFRREHGNQFDPPAMERIQESIVDAQRMHTMVKDLLAFSNALESPENGERFTDATESLREALSNLSTAIRENHAELRFDSLPLLRVQQFHLTQLFQNLIGNALKYRKPDVTPIIEISAESAGDQWVFSIVDNGIGFDPAYAERIFGVFKRLHHHSKYPGTGIGLAICSRIVTHYGGRIWAEGEQGKGATFRFTLPAQSSSTTTWMSNQSRAGGSAIRLAKESG